MRLATHSTYLTRRLTWLLLIILLSALLLAMTSGVTESKSVAKSEASDVGKSGDRVGFSQSWPSPSFNAISMAPSPCEVVWLEDSLPEGATAYPGNDGWNWVASNPAPYSGMTSHQTPVIAGVHDHYFVGATTTLTVNGGELLYAYVYLDPSNMPREIMLSWNDGDWGYRAYWGENLINAGVDGTNSRRYMGALPAAGQWVRLEVPASAVGLEGHTLKGLSFLQYDGRATWDQAGKICLRDKVWVDDSVPTGGVAVGTNEGWNWVTSNPTPFSGKLVSQSNIVSGFHQHYFYGATNTLAVNKGEHLIAYVFLDPANLPSELMLQWADTSGSWEHRAYWGADNSFAYGTNGTDSRRYMGPLPAAGKWVRLQVPASLVGLEGKTLDGMAFSMWDGRAAWDYAGTSPAPASVAWVDDHLPAGATAIPGSDGWNWITSNPASSSGKYSHQSPVISGPHDHYFLGATSTLPVNSGDFLYAYVYLDPSNTPREIMLSWNDGNWGYRAYWGENLINAGVDGTNSRRYMGPLPAAGQWVRLEVPAGSVGLEGHILKGMSFLQYDGRATWDQAGKSSPQQPTSPPPPTTTPTPPPTPVTLHLSFDGRLRDRVSQNETSLTGDGLADGTFTVTFPAGTGGQTITSMRLDRGDGVNAWDTVPGNGTWAVGVARTLDGEILNSPNSAVSIPVANGNSFKIFVADTTALFAPGQTFTLNVTFSNASTGRGTVTLNQTSQEFTAAQLDPRNRTGMPGVDLLSGNYNWSMPLISLNGRSGLDLSLSLVYNSLVWTRNDSSIRFDADRGFPSAGFRLGLPVIQPQFFNPETGKNTYPMIMPSGERIELRQVSANTYESADSSYLRLTVDGSVLTVKTTNGTRLSFTLSGGEYHCTEIKDRNGNFISINNDAQGRINTITDTVGRVITFNYDPANGAPTSITQPWNVDGQTLSHKWAEFSYTTINLQTNFGTLAMVGAQNGQNIRVLERVTYADGSSDQFSHTSWGQVYKISRFAPDGSQLRYTTYNLPGSTSPQSIPVQTDCPRFTERRDAAVNWNGAGNSPSAGSEVTTQFSIAAMQGNGVGEMTTPDGVVTKEFFASAGWQNGVTQKIETWSKAASAGGVLKKTVNTTWTQDNEGLTFKLNPRPADLIILDGEGSRRRRTHYEYNDVADPNVLAFGLASNITEYGADDTSPLRRTQIKYNHSPAYISNRVIGLISEQSVYDQQGVLASKTTYEYDHDGFLQATSATPKQHDSANFGVGFREGRGNVTRVRRWDVNDRDNINKSLATDSGYNTAGSPIFSRIFSYDDLGNVVSRQSEASYADALNTFAYPTSVTDPDGHTVQMTYNYDMGVRMSTTDQGGATLTSLYDGVTGRVTRTELNNRSNPNDANTGTYTRYVYSPSQTSVETYTRVDVGLGEAFSAQVFDGAGRVHGTISSFPGSTGGYRAQRFTYNVVGQLVEQSNPIEVSVDPNQKYEVLSWRPAGDDAATGWQWSKQDYDWRGRPTISTNADGTQRTRSYEGCGCAGGDVVTAFDEVGRKQKSYADALGRVTKVEMFNHNDALYSTVVSTYNALDRATNVKHYQGAETSGVFQETVMTYDGYGRLFTRHSPAQRDANNQPLSSVYTYNPDDTPRSITDARGATTNFYYNARQLVRRIVYGRPLDPATNQPRTGISESPTVEFGYDEAGNRKWMTDGLGRVDYNYDTWGMLKSETRYFNDILASSPSATGEARKPFTLSYDYTLAGQLKNVTDQAAGTSLSQRFDEAGQIADVRGTGFGSQPQTFISSAQYRAWGGLKRMVYGNGITLSLDYNKRGFLIHYGLDVLRDTFGTSAPEGGDFQYYADGRVKFGSDLRTGATSGGLHDRAYVYDQAGRLKEAYSGTQARDFRDGTNTTIYAAMPFRQSYDYDVWGNMTARTGTFWSRDDNFNETYNLQDRNVNWEYDEDGRLVSRNEESPNDLAYKPLRNTIDAAGRLAQQTQMTSRRMSMNQSVVTKITVTKSRSYDGNGLVLKQTQTKQYNSGTPTSTSTYSLRSTVLGGRVLSEYDSAGVRNISFVYAGGELIAQQAKSRDGSMTTLLWQHTNPVVGDQLNTDLQGTVVSRTTLDPTGVNVGDYDPFVTESGQDSGEGMSQSTVDSIVARLIPGYGGAQCTIDGMVASCASATSAVASGAAVQCPNNYCGPLRVVVTGENEDGEATRDYLMTTSFKAYADGWAGYTVAGISYVGDGLLLNDYWKNEFQADSNKLSFQNDFTSNPLLAAMGNYQQSETGEKRQSSKPKPPIDNMLTLPGVPSLGEVINENRQRDERALVRKKMAEAARWNRWDRWHECANSRAPMYQIKRDAILNSYWIAGGGASAAAGVAVVKETAKVTVKEFLKGALPYIGAGATFAEIAVFLNARNQLNALNAETEILIKPCGPQPPHPSGR